MNILSRLFGKKQNNEIATAIPSESLFMETNAPADEIINAALHPETEPQPAPVSPKGFVYTRPADIRSFLDKDYRTIGEQDAMLNPTAEMRTHKLDAISKRFRFTIQHVDEQLVAQIKQVQQNLILMADVSPVIAKKSELRLKELQDMVGKLERQAELSVDGEGWIAPVLADYKEGFIAGAMRFQRENELLSGVNTLT